MNEATIRAMVEFLANNASDVLLPSLLTVFCLGAILRLLVTFTVSRESWFAKEFEKRVHGFLETAPEGDVSFYVITKKLLEKTYYELFEVRAIMKRRKPDAVRSLHDRLFLIQHGCARLVKDALRQVKFLKTDGSAPKMLDVSQTVFENNPCFRKVFGIIPVSTSNDFLSVLPGLFIVCGIFGTFLGIMKALPELGGMDVSDAEATKVIMDGFLARVAFSMSTSVVGILLSVTLTVINTALSAERSFVNTVNRFENSLTVLWNRSRNNALPGDIAEFDEHKDPIDALAEEAINKQLNRRVLFIQKAS